MFVGLLQYKVCLLIILYSSTFNPTYSAELYFIVTNNENYQLKSIFMDYLLV